MTRKRLRNPLVILVLLLATALISVHLAGIAVPVQAQTIPEAGPPLPKVPAGQSPVAQPEGTAKPPIAADGASAVSKGHVLLPAEGEPASAQPLFDLEALPFPAKRMHELLLEAARAGDVEKLRPYAGSGEDTTMFSFGGVEGDPIDFLKSLSGDGEGFEILAIMQDLLQAGFVHVEAGTEYELYVWPYFYGLPIDNLTPAQRVELYRVVTHGDFEDMKAFGAYNFYRVGITPQGRWQFFVAGD